MAKHEIRVCVRCGDEFECKVGSIHLCQCWDIPLDEEERACIKEKYDDCLCAKCLIEERDNYHQEHLKKELKSIGIKFEDHENGHGH